MRAGTSSLTLSPGPSWSVGAPERDFSCSKPHPKLSREEAPPSRSAVTWQELWSGQEQPRPRAGPPCLTLGP